MRLLGASVLLAMAMMGFLRLPTAVAQDATPAATPSCATTTPEENTALVLDFLDAAQTVDDDADTTDEAATMDAALAEDVTYSVEGAENAPGNADETQFFVNNAAVFEDFSFTIEDTVASDNLVAVHFKFQVNDHNIPGATEGATAEVDAALIAQIDCGEIVHFTEIVDTASLLSQLGVGAAPAADATPAA